MQSNLYVLLTGILLAGAVASCSADQEPDTTQRPTTARQLSATPPAPVEAAPSPPAVADQVLPTRPSGKKVSQQAVSKIAPLPTRPPQGRAKVTPTRPGFQAAPPRAFVALAPTPQPEPTAAGQLLPLTSPGLLASAPDSTDNNLQAFCEQAAPAVQLFRVQPGRDTVLLGQQGTRLLVPGQAFNVPASSGSVELRMREFYSIPDIVLAGLGTRTGLDLLETGGMLHLDAVAAGQPVSLRLGMHLLVQLPTRQQLPGMQLYEGLAQAGSPAPNWQLPATSNPVSSRAALGKWVALHPPKSPRWPRFELNDKALLKEFDRLMPDSKADQAWLRRKRTVDKAERLLLQELSRENHTAIRHALVFEVVVDSAGTLLPPHLVAGDSVLGERARVMLRQLPAQHAASFVSSLPHGRRTGSTARGVFSVLYARSGRRLMGFSWYLMDKHVQEELAKEAQRSRAEFAREFKRQGQSSAPLTLDGGLYYELMAGGLGWINCDRLLDPGPRIAYTVQAPAPATVVSLVFQGSRSILASSRTDGNAAVFEQVPSGQPATIVALRRAQGITYLATTAVHLGQATPPDLHFHPVTLDELRTELAQL